MRTVRITGAGMTRFAKHPDRNLRSLSLGLYEALQWEATVQTVNFGSDDTREGITVFRGR